MSRLTYTGHFRDESFQAVNCTGSDNQCAHMYYLDLLRLDITILRQYYVIRQLKQQPS